MITKPNSQDLGHLLRKRKTSIVVDSNKDLNTHLKKNIFFGLPHLVTFISFFSM